jgi:hypothetical protein
MARSKKGVDHSKNPFAGDGIAIFCGENVVDGNPFSSPGIELFNVSKIEEYKKKFSSPCEEKLEIPVMEKTHWVWEQNAKYFNDGAIKVFEKFDPDHWTFDHGGAMGNVIFFNKRLSNG